MTWPLAETALWPSQLLHGGVCTSLGEAAWD